MPKGGLLDDLSEQLLELGQSTIKTTAKAIGQTISPVKIIEQVTGAKLSSDPGIEKSENGGQKKPTHTQIDFNKLEQTYKNQDKQSEESLRNRLFNLVKSGEEKAIQENKQKKLEKERDEEQEKIRKQNEQYQLNNQPLEEPQGKIKMMLGGKRKKASPAPHEVKASKGK